MSMPVRLKRFTPTRVSRFTYESRNPVVKPMRRWVHQARSRASIHWPDAAGRGGARDYHGQDRLDSVNHRGVEEDVHDAGADADP